MRVRTDSLHIAGWKRAHDLLGCPLTKPLSAEGRDHLAHHVSHRAEWADVEPAAPGDVWILRNTNRGIVGYALTCPKVDCHEGVHPWDHAYNCPVRTEPDAPPCWSWSGSIEEGNLTAAPSLQVMTEIDGKPTGSCGYHGFLQSGQMSPSS